METHHIGRLGGIAYPHPAVQCSAAMSAIEYDFKKRKNLRLNTIDQTIMEGKENE
jgi:hypothetical protein